MNLPVRTLGRLAVALLAVASVVYLVDGPHVPAQALLAAAAVLAAPRLVELGRQSRSLSRASRAGSPRP